MGSGRQSTDELRAAGVSIIDTLGAARDSSQSGPGMEYGLCATKQTQNAYIGRLGVGLASTCGWGARRLSKCQVLHHWAIQESNH